ncbi:outer membrane protein transport protein [Moritella sp. F3]|uniref:outer membrane protein transport protein n=1 Tax=Moritella sp. F3 TaxID=2718882 RepID=UPI0018E145FF|nr:outer membrane protein transport protein [Moritella sp. F3]GIC75664.1 long-chain fatty acid transporter [Moritella sp. F1]GIC80809.1 long-chain fatty acid transporter [Moritella sp. F3]
MRHLRRAYPVIMLACIGSQVQAAGFQLNAQSATGLGRAYAGDGIIADNASVMAKNSAAMALFDQPSLSVGAIGVITDVSLTDASYTPMVDDTVDANVDDIANAAFIPNFYYVHPIADSDLTLGLAMYSNFGTSVEFPDDYVASEFGGETSLTSINIGLSAAYQLTDKLSLGAGLDVIYGEGQISRDNLLEVEADGVAYGFNLGLAYEFNDNNRIGLSYRYSPDLEASGDVDMTGEGSADSINIPLPDMIELSGYHRVMPKLAFHYSVQYVQWSEFDSLTSSDFDSNIKDYAWTDAGHISVGTTYYPSESWELRAGYMYDHAPTDSLESVSIPDSNRHWLSVGTTYKLSQSQSIDLGVSYILGEDTAVEESLTTIPGTESSINGVVESSAWLFGLQYNHSF